LSGEQEFTEGHLAEIIVWKMCTVLGVTIWQGTFPTDDNLIADCSNNTWNPLVEKREVLPWAFSGKITIAATPLWHSRFLSAIWRSVVHEFLGNLQCTSLKFACKSCLMNFRS
jgi:hypothetical protein